MRVLRLGVRNLRNLHSLDIEPVSGLNLIIGPNGSGKTGVLEALFLLGRGRSFRAATLSQLVAWNEPGLSVVGLIASEGGATFSVGVERGGQDTRIRMAGQSVASAAELAAALPVLLMAPENRALLDGGPRFRRRFVDWGAFHTEPGFLKSWRRFQRALRQRNEALRGLESREAVVAWHRELGEGARAIDGARARYVERLQAALRHRLEELLPTGNIVTVYHRGWREETEYEVLLDAAIERDRAAGYTQLGPHRADLELRYAGVPARQSLSRGQQKLLLVALSLAQLDVHRASTEKSCVVLVDDLPAELDEVHRQVLFGSLAGSGSQVFVTATEPVALLEGREWGVRRLFRMEQGGVAEVI